MNLSNWLYDKGRNYPQGVELFIKLGVDPTKNQYFNVAKPDKSRVDMLWRLLTNYARIHNIRPAKPQLQPVQPVHTAKLPAAMATGIGQSIRPKVVKSPHVNYDELPDELKALWDDAAAKQTELKSYHNKLKLISTTAGQEQSRAELCSLIVTTDAHIRANYAVIDDWYLNGRKPITADGKEITVMSDLEKDKRIKANLNYLRRYFHDPAKQAEVKQRRDELDKWGVNYERLIAKITS